jgi:short-subunit dehydrogenase
LILKDSVVLLTGASSGIGAALAKKLIQGQSNVVLTALPSAHFPTQQHPNLLQIPGDITDSGFCQNLVEQAILHFGRVDVLINCAGIGLYGGVTDAPLDLARKMFDLNVWAPCELIELVAADMKKRNRGSIVNLGSVAGFVGLQWAPHYSASKAALHSLNDALRRELRGTGIQVLRICIGVVKTDFRKHVLGGKPPSDVEKIRFLVTPEQVADTIISGIESNSSVRYVPGLLSRAFVAMNFFTPGLMDWYLTRNYRQ